MAKIKHNNPYDLVDNVVTSAKNRKLMHLCSQEEEFNGKYLKINDNELVNFGTCGYLGLEKHPEVLDKSQELLYKYGSHFSISRSFVKAPYMVELESLVSQIFDNHPVVVFTSTSVAHQSVLGTIIGSDDLIILDQQVHYSVQYPCQHTKLQGTVVKMIRHNNMEMLEDFIKRGYNQYEKIWYMADGVYSMHGDLPNKKALLNLLEKYPKLHLYFDDAHGVGWTGKNGSGSAFEDFKHSDRVVLMSTLAKGFGCIGGIAVFNDKEMHRRVDTYGGILSYTHPLSPSNVGAAIGAAKLMLSDTIHQYQYELRNLMDYLNAKLHELNLPNTSSDETPIYFIGTGSVKVTYNLIAKVLADGLYVNTATFPVVPNDKCGLRFTLTRHNTKEQIDQLVDSIARNFPLAVAEENEDIEKIYKTFNIPYKGKNNIEKIEEDQISVETYSSIREIEPKIWDDIFKDKGNFSHNGLLAIEEIFSGNPEEENNWSFHYIFIKDTDNKIICASFFTGAIYKDDMLAPENISKQIEIMRESDPYFLCSKTLAMGSMFSEGEHFYVDKTSPNWKDAVKNLLDEVSLIKKKINANVVLLRDFYELDDLAEVFEYEGYAKIDMPNSNKVKITPWATNDDFLKQISSKNNKRNIKRYVFDFEDLFDISFKKNISDFEAEKYYELFENIKSKNHSLNFFSYPQSITKALARYDEWEFMDIKFKGSNETVCSVWSYTGSEHYSPVIMGLDYHCLESHHIYKQAIYQLVKRANLLGKKDVYLGFSADYEKQKYGAQAIPTYAFMKIDDTYNFELIQNMTNTNVK